MINKTIEEFFEEQNKFEEKFKSIPERDLNPPEWGWQYENIPSAAFRDDEPDYYDE